MNQSFVFCWFSHINLQTYKTYSTQKEREQFIADKRFFLIHLMCWNVGTEMKKEHKSDK